MRVEGEVGKCEGGKVEKLGGWLCRENFRLLTFFVSEPHGAGCE